MTYTTCKSKICNWLYDATNNHGCNRCKNKLYATMNQNTRHQTTKHTKQSNCNSYGIQSNIQELNGLFSPNSNLSHHDNTKDSISAPRHPSMSGRHLENHSSHHNKINQLCLRIVLSQNKRCSDVHGLSIRNIYLHSSSGHINL